MKTPQFFLGVDGGASKTAAVLIDANKKVIGRGQAKGSNANVFGLSEAVEQVYLATREATASLPAGRKVQACFAIAGVNTTEDKTTWGKAIKKHPELSKLVAKSSQIVNDTLAALRSGTIDKNALVIIAGTGSNCYGRNDKGQEAKSGGVDYLLSDEGSGFDIGLKILKSVTRQLDGRGRETILTKLLFEKLKINSLTALQQLVYKKPWNKTDIAQLAPLVEIALRKNDQVAIRIIETATNDLSLMIKAVAKKLGLLHKAFTLVTVGSLFKSPKILSELKEKVLKFSPRAQFTKQNVDSATAAAYLALEKKSSVSG